MIMILDMSGDEVMWRDEPEAPREQRLPGYGERADCQLQLQLVSVTSEQSDKPLRAPRYRR